MIERLLAAEAALTRGELEHAERLFNQVSEADPRNAIAVVGLARIASRRGRSDEARSLVQRALAIDPDEAAARRLLVGLDVAAAPGVVGPASGQTAAPERPAIEPSASEPSAPASASEPSAPASAAAPPSAGAMPPRRPRSEPVPAARPSLVDRLLRLLGLRRGA